MVVNSEFAKARVEQEAASTVRYRIQFRNNDIGRHEIEQLTSLFTNGQLEYKNCIDLINRAKLDDKIFKKLLILAQQKDNQFEIKNDKEQVKKLNLENITDFTKDGKNYIKIRYDDGTIRIIENNKNASGKEIFEYIQSNYNINGDDGSLNATIIFESLIRSCHEVKLKNVKNMNKEELEHLKIKEKELFNVIRKKYVGYEIIASPDENIYVIAIPGKDEKIVSVEKKNGMYVILEVDEKGYKNNKELHDNKLSEKIDENIEKDNNGKLSKEYMEDENIEYDKAKEVTYIKKQTKSKQLVKRFQYPYSKAGFMDAALLALIVGLSGMSLTTIMLLLITK